MILISASVAVCEVLGYRHFNSGFLYTEVIDVAQTILDKLLATYPDSTNTTDSVHR